MTDFKSLPILYSFRRCPYAMRARMALYYAGIQCEIREITLRDKPPEMLALSPKGTVPVLKLSCGTIIDESLDIMRWALNQNDPDTWLCDTNRTDIDALINQNDTVFKNALDRYKYPSRYPDENCTHARTIGLQILQDLDKRLSANNMLFGTHIGLADSAIFPFIRQFAFTDTDWFNGLNVPYLQKWLNEHLESSLFIAIMKKYNPWKNGDIPVLLLS